jgi:CubicO group peptidase (beta-lactamase class C family)
MRALRRLSILCTALLVTSSVGASESLDNLVRDYMQTSGAPGVSIIVIKDDKIVHDGAYGLASVELAAPVTKETVYQIASTTKVFTGVAIMMLVEQGKISLSQHIREIVSGLPEAWDQVTVQHLLTHTSGIPDALDEHGRAIAESPDRLFEILETVPVSFAPGDGWSYNQTGYVLAGEIIRLRTGLSFDEFCQKHIFDPLGMKSTSFGGVHRLIANRASAYTAGAEGNLVPFLDGIYPELTWTGAGINTTTQDFALFDIALQQGRLLKPETMKTMLSPVQLRDRGVYRNRVGTTGYGCGWAQIAYPDHPAVGMEGGLTNAYYRFVEDDLAVIVLTNLVDREPPIALVERIAGRFIAGFSSPLARLRQLDFLLNEGNAKAGHLARELVEEGWSNPALLNSVAWDVATTGQPAGDDLETALRAARQAGSLTDHQDAGILDTLARVYFEMGDSDRALQWQESAVKLARDPQVKEELSKVLAQYIEAAGTSSSKAK